MTATETPSDAAGAAHVAAPRIDDELIGRIARGDVEAFGSLYDRLAGNVLGFARHAVGCGQTAERAVVQAFVEVWRRAAEFDGSRDALGWAVEVCTARVRQLCPEQAGRSNS